MSEGTGPSGPDDQHDPQDEQFGSVADEAAKLFGALSDWAREANDHIATGGAECTYCPICRTVHAVRSASPEVRSHLTVAAASLMQAAAGLLATAVPDERRAQSTQGDGFEHIDLEDDLADDLADDLRDEPEEDA